MTPWPCSLLTAREEARVRGDPRDCDFELAHRALITHGPAGFGNLWRRSAAVAVGLLLPASNGVGILPLLFDIVPFYEAASQVLRA